jgi:recombination protein RecA
MPRKSGKKKVTASQLDVMLEAREFLQKKHGEATVIGMDAVDSTIPGYVSTQSLALDALIGNGGLPQSRLIEIAGPEGAGKSTLADHIIAEIQARGGQAYLWDTENARDNRYVDRVGIVRKKASKIEADTMEQGFEVMIDTLEWYLGHYPAIEGVIVWDTVAGVPTEAELDPDATNEAFGPAKLIKGNLRKLIQTLKKTRWILVAVNQEYTATRNRQSYRVSYGGGGIPYFSSIRLSVWPGEKIFINSTAKANGIPPIGQVVSVRSVKNKVFPPLRIVKAAIMYGEGIDNTWTLFDTLKGAGMITTAGGWHNLDWPEVAELDPRPPKFQGGFLGLKALCTQNEKLWDVLLAAYQEVTK